MTVIGYIRVSSDKQDLQKQEHLLLKSPNSITYRYFVRQDPELLALWRGQK